VKSSLRSEVGSANDFPTDHLVKHVRIGEEITKITQSEFVVVELDRIPRIPIKVAFKGNHVPPSRSEMIPHWIPFTFAIPLTLKV
jgi:hypothetical protein